MFKNHSDTQSPASQSQLAVLCLREERQPHRQNDKSFRYIGRALAAWLRGPLCSLCIQPGRKSRASENKNLGRIITYGCGLIHSAPRHLFCHTAKRGNGRLQSPSQVTVFKKASSSIKNRFQYLAHTLHNHSELHPHSVISQWITLSW